MKTRENVLSNSSIIGRSLLIPLLGLAQVALAQSFDFISGMKPIQSLRFPEPVETAPPPKPPMSIYKPKGSGPFAAVVIHHTCGNARDHIGDWARAFFKAGYVVLALDSLTQRGAQTNCSLPLAVPTANGTLDAYQALEHLAGQAYVDKTRIGLIGFSWGGMAALLAARPDIADRLPRTNKEWRYAAVVAAYPHCFIPASYLPSSFGNLEFLSPDTDRPLLVLMGDEDEESPAKYCVPRLEALKAKGMKIDWDVYPNATHAWDSKQLNKFYSSTLFGAGHIYAYSEQATQLSRKRVLEFFARELGKPR